MYCGPLLAALIFLGNDRKIRELGSSPKIYVSAKDAITDVSKVGRSRVVKEYGVLQLAGVSNDASVANEHVPTDVRIVTDFASVANVSGARDMCPWLDARVVTDIYGTSD